MTERITHGECAHCGVLVEFSDPTTICLFLSEWSAFVYHPWCWEEAAKRIVGLRSQRIDDMSAIDLMDLGIIPGTTDAE